MCEHSNVNSAAALREARRRKILENSENRLKLIEGISSFPEKGSAESFLDAKPDPEVHKSDNLNTEEPGSELNYKFTDFIKTNKELKETSDFLLKDHNKIYYEKADEEEVIEEETTERERCIYFKIFIQKKLHYVFLALIVNILFFCDAGNVFYENIFCPFYTLKAIELISVREKEDFQPVLFFLIASLPKNVQKFIKSILPVMAALFSDLCLYLFTFIIGTKILNKQN